MSLQTPELSVPGPLHPAAPHPPTPVTWHSGPGLGAHPAVRVSPVYTGDPAKPADLARGPRLLSHFHRHLLRPPAPQRGSKTPRGQAHAGGSPRTCPPAYPAPSCREHASRRAWPRACCRGVGVQPGPVTAGSPQNPGGLTPSEPPTLVWLGPTARQTRGSGRPPERVPGPGRRRARRPGLGLPLPQPAPHPATEQEQSGPSRTSLWWQSPWATGRRGGPGTSGWAWAGAGG